jgi:hypothetical protein
MKKKVLNKGVYTKGKYTFGKKGKPTKEYSVWLSMLTRCYNERFLMTNETYIGCTVCDEWLDFQNFAEWFNENHIDGYQLDKDLIIKGNKIYSPQTCCFVPQEINLLLVNRKRDRGEYPIGVSRDKTKMSAHIVIKAKQVYLGNYNTVEEAFNAYKTAKEANILSMAEEYKDRISEKVYESLLNYTVNIND